MSVTDLNFRPETKEAVLTPKRQASRSRRLAELVWLSLPLWDVLVLLVVQALTSGMTGWAVFGGRWDAAGIGVVSSTTAIMVLVALGTIAVSGTYAPRVGLGGPSLRVFRALLVASGLAVLTALFYGAAVGAPVDLTQLAATAIALPLAWSFGRLLARSVATAHPEHVLVIGTGPVARRVLEITYRHPRLGSEIVGFVDDNPLDMGPDAPPVVGGLASLRDVVRQRNVDRVIVAFTNRGDVDILEVLRACDPLGVHVDVVPRMFDLMGPEPISRSFEGLPLLGVRGRLRGPGASRTKRAFDIATSLLLLVVAGPLLLVLALAVRLGDGGPVFYRQERSGLRGAPFRVMKFRTMTSGADRDDRAMLEALERGDLSIADVVDGIKGDDDPRVTRVGRFLRATSLDELPQLFNVLFGQMSIVGPRPLRDFEIDSLDAWQRTRQTARPGITGFWQVLGRSEIGWSERVQLDYDYVRHWSMRLDFWIMLRTVPAVLRRKGAK